MKRWISVILVLCVLAGFVLPANAENGFDTEVILIEPEPIVIEITQEDGAGAIVNALYDAQESASEQHPYVIHVAAGYYTLDRAFHIFSNTSIISDEGAVFFNAAEENMLKVGTTGNDPVSGYGYENITVQGGEWNGNNANATMFKFVHAKNCVLKDVKAYNIKDAHFVETAGTDGLQVLSCSFSQMNITTNNGTEAIQIDVLQKDHIAGYEHLDDEIDYLCRNIVIDNCVFNTVRRAIGSHTSVYGEYFDTITITNNRFINTTEKSILCFNMKNLLIEGNSIVGEGVGIEIKTMDRNGAGSYLSTANMQGNYVKPKYLEISILNNSIQSNTDHAILLNGIILADSIAAKAKNNDFVPKGAYFVQGVQIENNTVCAFENKCGIKAQYAYNTVIRNNTVTASSTAQTPIYVCDGGYYVSVMNNTIFSPVLNGIRVCNLNKGYPRATIAMITGNTIHSVIKDGYGIRVSDAAVETIANNVIIKSANLGIQADVNPNTSMAVSVKRINANTVKSARIAIKIMKGTVSEIHSNVLYPTTESSLMVCENSVVGTIHKNTISNSGDTAILLKKSKVTQVSSNVIRSPKKHGIYCYDGYGAQKILSNSISGAKENGIYINGVVVQQLNSNAVSSCKNIGIYINGSDTKTQVLSVKANKVSACTYAMKILKGPKVNVYVNSFTKNSGGNQYIINGNKQYKLSNVPSTAINAKKSGNTIKLTWAKKGSVSGYLLYRSTKATGGFAKIAGVSASVKAYTDKTAKAKTVYYYRLFPYYKVPGTEVVIYANYSLSKGVKR